MNLSDKRAREIAEAAIRFEAAKAAASAKLVETEKSRRWDGRGYVYESSESEKEINEGLSLARSDRDSKRRAYQRQIKAALLEMVS